MTHLEEDPNTMNSYDRFYRMAMRDLYRRADHVAFTDQQHDDLLRLRDRWRYLNRIVGHNDHRPLKLNEGTPYESAFTVEQALVWAERLAS